jgi:hypothetical protein
MQFFRLRLITKKKKKESKNHSTHSLSYHGSCVGGRNVSPLASDSVSSMFSNFRTYFDTKFANGDVAVMRNDVGRGRARVSQNKDHSDSGIRPSFLWASLINLRMKTGGIRSEEEVDDKDIREGGDDGLVSGGDSGSGSGSG